MEGGVEMLETYPKSEEIINCHPEFSCVCKLYTVLAITVSGTQWNRYGFALATS